MGQPACTMCGRDVERDREWVEQIDGLDYMFDSQECALIFKKFRSVYGKEFFKPA
jgi:YHS domain-containing protein